MEPAFSRFEGEKVKETRIPKESLYVSKNKLYDYPAVQRLSKVIVSVDFMLIDHYLNSEQELERITPELLQAISRTLTLSPSLESFHSGASDQLAFHHYPEVPEALERSPAHRDWSLLTLLMYEDTGRSNGLEIAERPYLRQGGAPANSAKFIPVNPGRDEITVLLGNMLPRLAKLHQWEDVRSCLHRVSGFGDRYSIACFINAEDDLLLGGDGTTAREHREHWETRSKVQD